MYTNILKYYSFGGTTFYSYVASPIAFKVLEKEQFSKLQNRVFPYFFQLQSFSPVILALSSPVTLTTGSLIALTSASVAGLTNLCILLPWTRKVKEERKDVARKYKDDKEKIEEMDAPLRKEFGKSHGLSLLFNLANALSILTYGVYLTKGLLKYVPK